MQVPHGVYNGISHLSFQTHFISVLATATLGTSKDTTFWLLCVMHFRTHDTEVTRFSLKNMNFI